MTRVSVLGTDAINLKFLNKRKFTKANLPGLNFILFYILVTNFSTHNQIFF